MKQPFLLLATLPLALAACGAPQPGAGTETGMIGELPERVVEIAAPYQDLTAVKINEADGCYVYRHTGPVETTFLPLRTSEGRPICTRAPGTPAPVS